MSPTKMEYVNLGKSGLKVSHVLRVQSSDKQVSKIILGCMQYGSGSDWMISDHEEGIRQLKYAYDKGINVCTIMPIIGIVIDSPDI
jgi:hypothetical protein